MNKTFLLSLGLLSAIALQGCSAGRENAGAPLAKMTYEHVEPLALHVGFYNIIDDASDHYVSAQKYGFAPNPLNNIKSYFNRRFEPTAIGAMHLDVIIKDVSIAYSQVRDDTPLSALFGNRDQYDITVSIGLQAQNDIGYKASVGFVAKRSVAIPSHFSVIERETSQQQSMRHLIADIDKAVINHLRNDFSVLP